MTLAFIENESIIQYPIGLVEVKRKFPNTSFPVSLEGQDLSQFGVVEVHNTPQPQIDFKTQKLVEGTPILDQGKWIQSWNIIELSPEEKQRIDDNKASSVRIERNKRLADCDWTQLKDVSVDTAHWNIYRQELRDITTQEGFPHNIIWPEKPQ